MEFKGTKGEWIARHNGSYMEVNREEDFEDGKRLAISVMVFNIKDGECVYDRTYEAEANAHLIAAAPELLEALIRLKTMYQDLEKTLYGQNLTVNNWHLNGDTEPIDSFFEDLDLDAIEYAENTISKALNK